MCHGDGALIKGALGEREGYYKERYCSSKKAELSLKTVPNNDQSRKISEYEYILDRKLSAFD